MLSSRDLGLRWKGGDQESLQGPGARGKPGTRGSWRMCARPEGARSGARAGRARRKGGGGEGLRRGRGRAELLEGPLPPPSPGPALAPSPGSLGTPPATPVRPHSVCVLSPSSVRRLLHILRTGPPLLPPPSPPPPPSSPPLLRLLPSPLCPELPIGPLQKAPRPRLFRLPVGPPSPSSLRGVPAYLSGPGSGWRSQGP